MGRTLGAHMSEHVAVTGPMPSVVLDGYDEVNQFMAEQESSQYEIDRAIQRGEAHPPWCSCQRVCGGDQ